MARAVQKRRRFEEEMRLMSYIRHRNIVRCYGGAMARHAGERDIMVLEYVAGGTLDSYIHETRRRSRLRVTEVLSIAIHIADALRYLHPIVVHRDLKPCNVMADEAGVMKARASCVPLCAAAAALQRLAWLDSSKVYMGCTSARSTTAAASRTSRSCFRSATRLERLCL